MVNAPQDALCRVGSTRTAHLRTGEGQRLLGLADQFWQVGIIAQRQVAHGEDDLAMLAIISFAPRAASAESSTMATIRANLVGRSAVSHQ
jgi:hypothetical protein